jgi:hypothetical protein
MDVPGRPAKTHLVLAQEGKSHRTKAEMKARKEAEEGGFTGAGMSMTDEVKANPRAAKEFRRVKKLFGMIERDDAIYAAVINRYCLLLAEAADLAEARRVLAEQWRTTDTEDLDLLQQLTLTEKFTGMIASLDRQLKAKRDQLLAIEKENAMTIMGALRTVPKTLPSKKSQQQNQWANLHKPG